MLQRFDLQPDFPRRDISDGTADMLEELLFFDRTTLEAGHTEAENLNSLYRMGHTALRTAAQAQLDPAQLAALSGGIGIYETLSGMVRPLPDHLEEDIVTFYVDDMLKKLSSDTYLDALIDATDEFRSKLPRVTRILGEGASRFWTSHASYVIGGAAITRQMEIAAMNDLENFDF